MDEGGCLLLLLRRQAKQYPWLSQQHGLSLSVYFGQPQLSTAGLFPLQTQILGCSAASRNSLLLAHLKSLTRCLPLLCRLRLRPEQKLILLITFCIQLWRGQMRCRSAERRLFKTSLASDGLQWRNYNEAARKLN